MQIIGYLGKDPEAKNIGEGTLVTFPMATTEIWRDKASREPKEKTQWHNTAIWNDALNEVAMKYLKKGAQAYVQGQIETRSWEKDGTTHYATEVVLRPFNSELLLLDKAERPAAA